MRPVRINDFIFPEVVPFEINYGLPVRFGILVVVQLGDPRKSGRQLGTIVFTGMAPK